MHDQKGQAAGVSGDVELDRRKVRLAVPLAMAGVPTS
jgi:hypothetical protein